MVELTGWPERWDGRVRVPGDKSLTHRGILMAALAEGPMELRGWLDAADTRASLRLARAVGVEVQEVRPGLLRLERQGDLHEPDAPIDCANSGTTMRLGAGLVAGIEGLSLLTGDASLSRRPMARVAEPLRQLGTTVLTRRAGTAPVAIWGGTTWGGQAHLEVASAQVKSACLLAGLRAEAPVTVHEPRPTRDHTERMIRAMGGQITVDGRAVTVRPGGLEAISFAVPGDPSSAAVWAAMAALRPGRRIVLENVLLNPLRTGFFRLLSKAGAAVTMVEEGDVPEPWGHIVVTGRALKAFQLGADEVPAMVDEVPLAALIATQAQGTSEISGAQELRVKESDRIQVTQTILRALGARIHEKSDGWSIEGMSSLGGGRVDAAGDHRMAMLTAVASSVAEGPIILQGEESVAISYPGFFKEFVSLRGE